MYTHTVIYVSLLYIYIINIYRLDLFHRIVKWFFLDNPQGLKYLTTLNLPAPLSTCVMFKYETVIPSARRTSSHFSANGSAHLMLRLHRCIVIPSVCGIFPAIGAARLMLRSRRLFYYSRRLLKAKKNFLKNSPPMSLFLTKNKYG